MDPKLADFKTLRHKLSMVHKGHIVAIMYRLVMHTIMALRVMRMGADMCQTNTGPKAILKEALDHPKPIVDILLRLTVTHLFQDRLKPTKVKEAMQQTPTKTRQCHRAMSVLSSIPQHRPSR
jgi:hypothetical protein